MDTNTNTNTTSIDANSSINYNKRERKNAVKNMKHSSSTSSTTPALGLWAITWKRIELLKH